MVREDDPELLTVLRPLVGAMITLLGGAALAYFDALRPLVGAMITGTQNVISSAVKGCDPS